jgi:LuxR family maltose regulon positive regulatory protein
MPAAIEQAQRADDVLPPDNLTPRNIIPFALASAYQAEGELDKASQAINEELKLGRAADNLWTVVRSLCDLADVRRIQGRLRDAAALCREALDEAEARGARQFGNVGYVLVKIGELSLEHNDLPAAREHVLEGVNLMQSWQQPFEVVTGYTALAAALQAQDETQGAREALRNAEQIQSANPNYQKLNTLVDVCRIRLSLAQGSPQEAARLAAEIKLGEAQALIFREIEQISLARVLLAQGRRRKALHLLAQLAEEAAAGARLGRLIEILGLQAVARQQQGDTDQALDALEKALAIGQREGYVRVFLDLGESMAALLRTAATRGVAPDYVSRLLSAFGAAQEITARLPEPGTPSLVEPLTERELEVLHLIGEGYSNRRIAEALVITINTVKKHASSIYGKLGVRSRTQAVVRGQELGLL